MLLFVFLGIFAALVLAITLFLNLSPEFGGTPTAEEKELYKATGRYEKDKFQNATPTTVGGFSWEVIKEFMTSDPKREPAKPIQVPDLGQADIELADSLTQLIWYGHSSFLLQIDGKNLLLDPMFGKSPSPVPYFGPLRFTSGLPLEVDELPQIDGVLFSHDHYDHLDYGSVKKLKDKVGQFYVPLGLAAHLREWGVEPEKIKEMDWHESVDFQGLRFTCAPSRHFSGRGLTDRYSTLWASWVIQGQKDKIFFSGDSGYGPHFKEIGEKYGPFDLALMECGQYNTHWQEIHMMPEETVQATLDVRADLLFPIHWGAFRLALHDWKDPIKRATAEAQKLNVAITTPKIGEIFRLGQDNVPNEKWWEEYE